MGFENAHVLRPGYAIEYDFFPPTQLNRSLETQLVAGLYFAGQINGTTGYEEAACQGLMAGINAARRWQGKAPIVLRRDQAYIGVLIDDLVCKGTEEPYRMFTSRAEFRISLRHSSADMRLSPIGHEVGLIGEARYTAVQAKKAAIEACVQQLERHKVSPADTAATLESLETAPLSEKQSLAQLLKRPQVVGESLSMLAPGLVLPAAEVVEEAVTRIKYSYYLEQEQQLAQKVQALESYVLPENIDYAKLKGLSAEGREKLQHHRPQTVGQAAPNQWYFLAQILLYWSYTSKR